MSASVDTLALGQEQAVASAVAAITATGTGGDERAVVTVSKVYAFLTPDTLLRMAEVTIPATATRESRQGNLLKHKRIADAAYALHLLKSETTAAEALEWAQYVKDLRALAAAEGQSADVRASVIRGIAEPAKAAAAQKRKERAEERKAIAKVASTVSTSLLEAKKRHIEGSDLTPEVRESLLRAQEAIAYFLSLDAE